MRTASILIFVVVTGTGALGIVKPEVPGVAGPVLFTNASAFRIPAPGQDGMGRRQYQAGDLEVLQVIGTAAGQMAVLVLALYIQSENVVRLYRHPNVLWLLCVAMFYWITRIWLKLNRGEVRQDPVVYALRDGASYAVGAAALLIAYVAAH